MRAEGGIARNFDPMVGRDHAAGRGMNQHREASWGRRTGRLVLTGHPLREFSRKGWSGFLLGAMGRTRRTAAGGTRPAIGLAAKPISQGEVGDVIVVEGILEYEGEPVVRDLVVGAYQHSGPKRGSWETDTVFRHGPLWLRSDDGMRIRLRWEHTWPKGNYATSALDTSVTRRVAAIARAIA